MNNIKMSLLLLIIVALVSACSRGPQSAVKLKFSLGYEVAVATNKVRVFPVKAGSATAFKTIDYNPSGDNLITIPFGTWTFYTVEWNGAIPYTGAIRCGISSTLDLKSGVETSVDVTPSEANCGAAFFKTIFDNYCYEPGTSTTTPFRGGTGTAVDPYVICNIAQLNAIGGTNFSLYQNSNFRLGRDINFYHKFSNITEPLTFIPLGSDLVSNPSSSATFGGIFDGANHVITGMNIDATPPTATTTRAEIGFIRALGPSAVVKNLTFVVPEIYADQNYPVDKVGIVAGETFSASQIENVHVRYGRVSARQFVGGLVGYAYMQSMSNVQIKNSSFTEGDIEGVNSVGGLLGGAMSLQGNNIFHSFTTGKIHTREGFCNPPQYKDQPSCTGVGGTWTEGGNAGGLIGYSQLSNMSTYNHITRSFSKMDIQGMNGIGGLIGRNDSPYAVEIKDSYSTGNLYGWGGTNFGVGGIVGYSSGATSPKLSRVFHTLGGISTTASSTALGRLFGYSVNTPQCENSFATGPSSMPLNCTPMGYTASVTYAGIRTLSTFADADWPIGTVAAAPPFVKMFGGGQHSCALTNMGDAFCWGLNSSGQLGTGTLLSKLFPAHIDAGTLFLNLEPSNLHTCGITTLGALKCWGGNTNGELGDGTVVDKASPIIIDPGFSYSKITTGHLHTCGITDSGVLKCWGDNALGKLGDGTLASTSTPTIIDSGTTYSDVSAGASHTCGITSAGILKCWGYNALGQLGNGTNTDSLTPTTTSTGTTFAIVRTTNNHSCAISTSNDLYCWGENALGQLGDSTIVPKNTPVLIGNGYSQVALGANHTCAITTTGILKCWGDGSNGELGNGSTSNLNTPTVVEAGSTFSSVMAGGAFTCAVRTDGIQKCWGYNISGQLGDGTTTQQNSPVAINQPPVWLMADPNYDYPQLGWEPPRACNGHFSGTWGSGSSSDPYQICSRAQFDLLGSNPSATFIMLNDIDLTEPTPRFSNYFPVGFSGQLNGNYHSINGLALTATTSVNEVGLFKSIDAGGIVKNFKMKAVNIILSSGSNAFMGAVAGINNGEIYGVSADNGIIRGDYFVGGIVGKNTGSIVKSSSDLNINGNYYVGGLVGGNIGGSILQSQTYGQVSTYGVSGFIGGLVGQNQGSPSDGPASISQSYSHSNIWLPSSFSSSNIGGLVGANTASGAAATISDSYAAAWISDSNTATLSIVSNLGGFVGNDQGTIERVFTNSYVSSMTASSSLPSTWGPFVGTAHGGAITYYGNSVTILNSGSVLNSYGGLGANTASYSVAADLTPASASDKNSYLLLGWNIVDKEPGVEDDPTTVWSMDGSYPNLLHTHDEESKGLDFMREILGF